MATSVLYLNFGGSLVAERRDGVYREYVPDTLGSTAALVDETGAVTDTFEYWPYGETASRTGNTPTPFTWVGTLGYYRDSAKLFYVRMRSYLANLGGWTSVDPLWPILGGYSYSFMSPLLYIDPSGTIPHALVASLIGAFGGCGAGWLGTHVGNAISIFTTGKGDPNIDCKAGVSCIAGAIAGLGAGITLGTLGGAAALGCLAGALSAVISYFGFKKCDDANPCTEGTGGDLCSALLDAALGCMVGLASGYFQGLSQSGWVTRPGTSPRRLPSWSINTDPISTNNRIQGSTIIDDVIVGGLLGLISNRLGVACPALVGDPIS